MKRTQLFAVVMAVLMVGGAVAFAGGAIASQNQHFDGQTVDAQHQIDTFYPSIGSDLNNVTIAMTNNVDLTAGQNKTFMTQVPADNATINASSGSGTAEAYVENGDVVINETGGSSSVTVEELFITFDVDQFPHVVPSSEVSAYNTSDTYNTTASVTFADQQTDGERVTVSADYDSNFYVVIHEVDDNGDPITEENNETAHVGVSAELTPGEYNAVNIELDETFDADTELNAMLHASNNSELGDPITDGSGNAVSMNSNITVQDIVMQSGNTTLVENPDGTEVHNYRVVDPAAFVDVNMSTDNGALNATSSLYEPDDQSGDSSFDATFTPSDHYSNVTLDQLEVYVSLHSDAFTNAEENTAENASELVLSNIADDGNYTQFKFEIVEANNFTEQTITVNGSVNAADVEDAIVVGAQPQPDGGDQGDGEMEHYGTELAGSAPFFGELGDFGLTEIAIGLAVLGLVGGGLWYAREEGMDTGGFGAFMQGESMAMSVAYWAALGAGVTMVADYFLDEINVWSDLVVGNLGLPGVTPLVAGAGIAIAAVLMNMRNSVDVGV